MTPARWHRLMEAWQVPPSDAVFSELVAAYSESHRHYHSGKHLEDCLARLDESVDLVEAPEVVEMALWFHDAIYKPTSSKNEEKSAEWAVRFLRSVGAEEPSQRRVGDLILATKHVDAALGGDSAVLVDIDLSILGRDPEVYDVYEDAIRKEYRWVPGPIYRRKRREVLESFLQRLAIFSTDRFRGRYEEPARANIERALAALSS